MIPTESRTALALNLELGGRHNASARVELLERPGAPSVAHVALRGWIDSRAERELERALDALCPRAVSRVVLDCSRVRRLAEGQVERLVAALSRLEQGAGPIEVLGLPSRPGIGSRPSRRARGWVVAAEDSESPSLEPSGEVAS